MRSSIYRWVVYAAAGAGLFGQATSTVGVVTKIDAAAQQMVVKDDKTAAEVTVNLQPSTSFRRTKPGENDLRNAATIAVGDINAGDRVLARGKPSDDQKSVAATLIVVMSKSDIASKQAAEKADWDKRGVVGVVTAASPTEIALNIRGAGGAKTLIVTPAATAVIRRYSPESVKFEDAKASTLGEIKTGDQVRARGEKSPDGAKMTAEEIVSGSFRELAATIVSIDAAQNQMRVNDLATKKQVTVKLNADSSVRKLPPQMAQMLAARNRPAEPGGRAGGPPPPEGRGPGGRGGNDLTQMLERVPKVTLADLKAGDAIILLSTVGATPDQLTAITMLAGVEPILTKPGTREMQLGEWSLGGGLGGGEP